MKLLRKLIVTPLILSLLAACFCLHASAMVIYDGDFGFEVNASKNEARLVKYIGNGGAVTLPAYYRDYPVTVIDRNAFRGIPRSRSWCFPKQTRPLRNTRL